jgi:alpha-ketoglutarate-dependent taurine dioxygenase
MQLPTDGVKDLFKANGILLFTGFEADPGVFEQFTNRFSNDYMDHRGGGSLREVINKEGDQTVLSVSYAYSPKKGDFDNKEQETFPLALHSDRSYTKSQPPLMWFYCAKPSVEKGETTVADGVQVYDGLSASTQKLFRDKCIKYVRTYQDGEWQLWGQSEDLEKVRAFCADNDLTLTVNPDDSITTEFTKHAVVKPRWSDKLGFVNSMLLVLWQEEVVSSKRSIVRFEDDSKIPADVIAEIREVSDSLTREIAWHPGEIAMLDNTRMLHGRRPFMDRNREIYVRMARSVDW